MPGNIFTLASKFSRRKLSGFQPQQDLLPTRFLFTFEQLEARWLLSLPIGTSHPYPGITIIHDVVNLSNPTQIEDINIAEIDLSTVGLNLQTTSKDVTTPIAQRKDTIGQTTLNYLTASNAQLAVNGNFFTPVSTTPIPVDLLGFAASLTVADAQNGLTGTVVSPYQSTGLPTYAVMPNAPAINIAPNHIASIVHYDPANPGLPLEVNNGTVQLGNALSGSAQIIINGALNPDITSSQYSSWNDMVTSRTAMGISQDGTKLVMLTVDSFPVSNTRGMKLTQIVDRFLSLPAPWTVYNAVNLDGGGSTNMSMQDPATGSRSIINSPYAPTRALGNNIAFFAPAPAAPISLAATTVNGSGNSTITWASGYANTNYGDSDAITIERSTDNINWTVVTSTTLANALSYTATGLAQNTTYYFRAKVSNAAFVSPSPYSSTAIALVINGTAGNDLQDVSWDGTYVTVHGVRVSPFAPAANVTSLLVNGGAGNDTIDLSLVNSGHGFNESVLFGRVIVQGDAGDDLITGGPISESLNGGDGSDTIGGGAGNDTIDGGAVYDRIHGGDGNDSIHGGTGDDALFGDRMAYGGAGSPGNDVIWGDEGNDDIIGGHWAITSNDGNDQIYGGSGSDRFYEVGGNQGNDIITDDQQDVPTYIDWIIFSQWTSAITLHLDTPGSQQNLSGGGSITISNVNSIENIWAGSGNDYLYGDGRANYLDGQQGDDHIYGRAGNDSLAGYDGYDYLYGEADNDLMWPEYGGGEMYGGTGNDTYDFVMTYGNNYFVYEDAIVGGSDGSSDTLDFTGAGGPVVLDLANSTTAQSFAGITLKLNDGMGIENVYCSQNTAFNWGDTLYGNARPNILKGGVGNDFIYGRGGADTLYGEDGNDYLDSGGSDGAADNISGGNGDDTLVNHDGPDVWDTIEHVL